MARQYRIGDRISFSKLSSPSELCTVRFIGEVDGFKGQWLGVEWDDDSRGKHDGCLEGKRSGIHHGTGLSPSQSAGSFVRASRPADREKSFVEAIYEKYVLGITHTAFSVPICKEIIISGKVVQEVGFDKIREIQARLHDLRIVILDGMRISIAQKENENITDFCPNIIELDLSRNLFRQFEDIHFICSKLYNIQNLRLNGNRFHNIEALRSEIDFSKDNSCITRVSKLELDEVLLPWESLVIIRNYFPLLTNLTASSNYIRSLTCPLMDGHLVSITLEYNQMESLSDLLPLAGLKSLRTLLIKGNKITSIYDPEKKIASGLNFGVNLTYVDLSYNQISSWSFIDDLSDVFPGLTGLRISSNPLYPNQILDSKISDCDENFFITVGRVRNLKTLNFSNITTAERSDAEMYYLAKIGQELSEVPENQMDFVISRHKRFQELSNKWGSPSLNREILKSCNPNYIENRLISFTFKFIYPHKEIKEEKIVSRQIPKSIDVYRLKALVGKLLGVSILNLRLIWETGEWDPVAWQDDDELNLSDNDITLNHFDQSEDEIATRGKDGRGWVKREVEIQDSTRQISSYIDGTHATMRVEYIAPKNSDQ